MATVVWVARPGVLRWPGLLLEPATPQAPPPPPASSSSSSASARDSMEDSDSDFEEDPRQARRQRQQQQLLLQQQQQAEQVQVELLAQGGVRTIVPRGQTAPFKEIPDPRHVAEHLLTSFTVGGAVGGEETLLLRLVEAIMLGNKWLMQLRNGATAPTATAILVAPRGGAAATTEAATHKIEYVEEPKCFVGSDGKPKMIPVPHRTSEEYATLIHQVQKDFRKIREQVEADINVPEYVALRRELQGIHRRRESEKKKALFLPRSTSAAPQRDDQSSNMEENVGVICEEPPTPEIEQTNKMEEDGDGGASDSRGNESPLHTKRDDRVEPEKIHEDISILPGSADLIKLWDLCNVFSPELKLPRISLDLWLQSLKDCSSDYNLIVSDVISSVLFVLVNDEDSALLKSMPATFYNESDAGAPKTVRAEKKIQPWTFQSPNTIHPTQGTTGRTVTHLTFDEILRQYLAKKGANLKNGEFVEVLRKTTFSRLPIEDKVLVIQKLCQDILCTNWLHVTLRRRNTAFDKRLKAAKNRAQELKTKIQGFGKLIVEEDLNITPGTAAASSSEGTDTKDVEHDSKGANGKLKPGPKKGKNGKTKGKTPDGSDSATPPIPHQSVSTDIDGANLVSLADLDELAPEFMAPTKRTAITNLRKACAKSDLKLLGEAIDVGRKYGLEGTRGSTRWRSRTLHYAFLAEQMMAEKYEADFEVVSIPFNTDFMVRSSRLGEDRLGRSYWYLPGNENSIFVISSQEKSTTPDWFAYNNLGAISQAINDLDESHKREAALKTEMTVLASLLGHPGLRYAFKGKIHMMHKLRTEGWGFSDNERLGNRVQHYIEGKGICDGAVVGFKVKKGDDALRRGENDLEWKIIYEDGEESEVDIKKLERILEWTATPIKGYTLTEEDMAQGWILDPEKLTEEFREYLGIEVWVEEIPRSEGFKGLVVAVNEKTVHFRVVVNKKVVTMDKAMLLECIERSVQLKQYKSKHHVRLEEIGISGLKRVLFRFIRNGMADIFKSSHFDASRKLLEDRLNNANSIQDMGAAVLHIEEIQFQYQVTVLGKEACGKRLVVPAGGNLKRNNKKGQPTTTAKLSADEDFSSDQQQQQQQQQSTDTEAEAQADASMAISTSENDHPQPSDEDPKTEDSSSKSNQNEDSKKRKAEKGSSKRGPKPKKQKKGSDDEGENPENEGYEDDQEAQRQKFILDDAHISMDSKYLWPTPETRETWIGWVKSSGTIAALSLATYCLIDHAAAVKACTRPSSLSTL